jgi:hypothetical protein
MSQSNTTKESKKITPTYDTENLRAAGYQIVENSRKNNKGSRQAPTSGDFPHATKSGRFSPNEAKDYSPRKQQNNDNME